MKNSHRFTILLAQNSTFIGLLVLIVIFTSIRPSFLSIGNAGVILQNVAELGILAIPLALLIMSGSVDLSVGSIVSAGGILSAMVMTSTGSAIIGLSVGIAFGAVAGAINGLLVSFLGLNPIVVTLGFLSIWGGFALYITEGATIAKLPSEFTDFGRLGYGAITPAVVLLVLVTVVAWYILNRRPVGRQILAIGGNKRASFLMGVSVRRVQFVLFVVTGMAASPAGSLMASKLFAASPTAGVSMEINALVVILIGGVAFEGGLGRISGVIAGLLLIGVLNNGLVVVGVSQFLQSMIIGIALVIALVLDKTVQRSVQNAWTRIGVKRVELSR